MGSPGGSTIITTVLQTLVNRIDLGMTLPEAVAAPRASHRNSAAVTAEPAFIDRVRDRRSRDGLHAAPRAATPSPAPRRSAVVAALEFLPRGRVLAVAEPVRRGGGDAGVVRARQGLARDGSATLGPWNLD